MRCGGGLIVAFALSCVACETQTQASNESANANATATAKATASATATVAASATAKKKVADPSRLQVKGEAVQGGLMHAKVSAGLKKIRFPGHRVRFSTDGEFLIAFFRNAPAKEKLILEFDDGSVLEREFEVKQRSYETDRIDGLPKHMVELDLKRRKKLAESRERIKKVRMKFSNEAHYQDGFIWPSVGRLTSRFGQPRVLNGKESGIHWGVDVAVPVGTPVKAPAGGKVVFAEKNVPLAGHTLMIDHGHGLTSALLHLRGFSKKVGDEVKQGDVVATVGMTGRTNGAHLDWRMTMFEIYVDPELLLPPPDAGD
jgi:murein DD-endopeptidase MepM/ murein hydrolase activator NlpD